MLQVLTTNPLMLIAVIVVAILLAKTLKVSGKIIKWCLLIAAAYWIITLFLNS